MLGRAHNLRTPFNKCRSAAPPHPHTVRALRLLFLDLGLRCFAPTRPYRILPYPALPCSTLRCRIDGVGLLSVFFGVPFSAASNSLNYVFGLFILFLNDFLGDFGLDNKQVHRP